jgi:acetyl esterase/lipase
MCFVAGATVALGAPVAVQEPTFAAVAYGPHRDQVLDFWQAPSDTPTPLVLYVHGGGWTGGNRRIGVGPLLRDLLPAGISVASIEYRLVPTAKREGFRPPLKGPMGDAARALQFVRTKATAWNVDPTRVCVAGRSAGGCMALWLAFHGDLADPASPDPVAHESTRPMCVAVADTQTTLDPRQMRAWIPNIRYGSHAFGFKTSRFAQFLAKRNKLLPWIAEYSPYALATTDDPPVYLGYRWPPTSGAIPPNPVHSANFGVGLEARLRALGVPCELVYPGAPDVKHPDLQTYLIDVLRDGGQRTYRRPTSHTAPSIRTPASSIRGGMVVP